MNIQKLSNCKENRGRAWESANVYAHTCQGVNMYRSSHTHATGVFVSVHASGVLVYFGTRHHQSPAQADKQTCAVERKLGNFIYSHSPIELLIHSITHSRTHSHSLPQTLIHTHKHIHTPHAHTHVHTRVPVAAPFLRVWIFASLASIVQYQASKLPPAAVL